VGFQGVLRVAELINLLSQAKRLAEHCRFHPAILLARGDVALGRMPEDIELQRHLAGVHQPVFTDASLPIRLTQQYSVFSERNWC